MNYQKDVSNFMILGEQKIASDLNLKNEQTQLYMNLIKEEFEETAKAFEEEDLVEVADGHRQPQPSLLLQMLSQSLQTPL